jgi:hypothetical protein
MAAQILRDIGDIPSSSDDPRLHDIYVAGARSGIAEAFAQIRLWEGEALARLVSDRHRLKTEYPRLHAEKVLQFRDVEASLLRDDIARIVNNPNLSAADMRDLARRALADDGQKISTDAQAARLRAN